MIALVLGSLLAEGVYVLFAATDRANTTQNALFRLQENARVAMTMLSDDVRAAGSLPCGSRTTPDVYVDDVARHLAGRTPPLSTSPVQSGDPPTLDRGVFLSGSMCTSRSCRPAAAETLRLGLRVGDQVPGSDTLVVRSLHGDGLAIGASGQSCDASGRLASLAVASATNAPVLSGLRAAHLALLAGCSQAQIFSAQVRADRVVPSANAFGQPACAQDDPQAQLFDLDTQLLAATYSLQLVADSKHPARTIAALVRHGSSGSDQVVPGVERFNLRYSLTDANGAAHWLNADQVARHVAADGAELLCGVGAAAHACAWSDINAVEISMLVNTIDDVPSDATASAADYRYAIDGDRVQTPGATMPVTGLPSGHKLRREFRSVIALRGSRA